MAAVGAALGLGGFMVAPIPAGEYTPVILRDIKMARPLIGIRGRMQTSHESVS